MYRAMEGVPVQSRPLPSGDQGTRLTVAVMQRLADEGSRDPMVRQAVIGVIRAAGVGDHNVLGQVQAWFLWVRDHIAFVNDPVNTELLQTPRVTLTNGGGDCDDRAILLAAGLKAFGVPAQFKVVAVNPQRPSVFSHVYVQAFVHGRWVALDPTYRQNTLGDEPPRRFRTWMVPA
jgi:transglutaminase-like putative cysteine protease